MSLTDRASELLAAIKKHGDWISRAEIAEATGKRRLSPHDRNLLEDLEASGLIEQDEQPAGISTKFVYKAK